MHGQESSAMFGWGDKGDDDGNGGRKREKKMKLYGWSEKGEKKKWGGWSFSLGSTISFPSRLERKEERKCIK